MASRQPAARVSFKVVIPARFAASRLPGKPLRLIAGRPLLEHVWARARASQAAEVVIATEDMRVQACAQAWGATVRLTSPGHASGTDRIAEICDQLDWPDQAVVVNLQGDEPLMPSENLDQVAARLVATEAEMASLCVPIAHPADLANPHVVKVVRDRTERALYFSRAPIPFAREGASVSAWRHLGVYAYRVGFLRRFVQTPPCALEDIERLEQLRALWLGATITVAEAVRLPGPSVDTEADLAAVERLMQADRA